MSQVLSSCFISLKMAGLVKVKQKKKKKVLWRSDKRKRGLGFQGWQTCGKVNIWEQLIDDKASFSKVCGWLSL